MLFSTPPKHRILVDKLLVASCFLSNKTLAIVTAFVYSKNVEWSTYIQNGSNRIKNQDNKNSLSQLLTASSKPRKSSILGFLFHEQWENGAGDEQAIWGIIYGNVGLSVWSVVVKVIYCSVYILTLWS